MSSRLRTMLEWTLGSQFFEGNSVDVLRNGHEIFPVMLDAIANAERSVDLLTYVYWRGDIAWRFAHALAERAESGVAVRIILDGLGCRVMDRALIRLLRAAGAEIQWFRPIAIWKIWNYHMYNCRTHRRVLVCDDAIAFTGGVGIAREWEGDARNEEEWRDTHYRIAGPAVRAMKSAFYANWLDAKSDLAVDVRREPPSLSHSGDAALQVVVSKASLGGSEVATVHRLLLQEARTSLQIVTPYFVPDQAALELLLRTAKRGVEIDIVEPGPHTDVRLCKWAARATYDELLRAGVRVWRYQPTLLHTKVIMVDGSLAMIGTANFDQRSMHRNDELCVLTDHPATIDVLRSHLQDDLKQSERLRRVDLRRRGAIARLQEWIAAPLKSEL